MVEALHIHSIAFDITDKLGLGKDIGLMITLLMFLILITFFYAYILSGNKPCLVLYTVLGLFATLLLHIGAVRVNLNNTPEVTHITHLLLCAVLLSTVLAFGYRLLKTKILDPIVEENSQKEFEQFLNDEGIEPDSPEAMELQSIWDWNCRDIIKLILNPEYDTSFDENEVKNTQK